MKDRGHKSDQPGVCNFKKVHFNKVSPHFCKFIWKAYEMILAKYVFFCYAVGNFSFYCESIQFQNSSWYGTKLIVFANQQHPSCWNMPSDVHGWRGHLLYVKLQQRSTGLSVLCWFLWKWNNRSILEYVLNKWV